MTDERRRAELLDLSGTVRQDNGAILSRETEDLDLNLVRFAEGSGVAAHVNREVDVLLVAVAGEGVVTVDGARFSLASGTALLIPKGSERVIQSAPNGEFLYLSVHRRRGGLMPGPRPSRRN
jgi:quercetin dioxygenase-like cupin family protein